jgi:hypothetical protein
MRLRSGTTYNSTNNDNIVKKIEKSNVLPYKTIHPMKLRSSSRSPLELKITIPSSPLTKKVIHNYKCKPICSQIDENRTKPPLTILEAVSALFALKNVYCCARARTCKMKDRICCSCSDRRAETEKYYAYNNSNLNDASEVSRSYYYCPSCVE